MLADLIRKHRPVRVGALVSLAVLWSLVLIRLAWLGLTVRTQEAGFTPVVNMHGTHVAYVVEIMADWGFLTRFHPDARGRSSSWWWEVRETNIETGETVLLKKDHSGQARIKDASLNDNTFALSHGKSGLVWLWFHTGESAQRPDVREKVTVRHEGEEYVFTRHYVLAGNGLRWVGGREGDTDRYYLHRDEAVGSVVGNQLTPGTYDPAGKRYVFTFGLTYGGDIWIADATLSDTITGASAEGASVSLFIQRTFELDNARILVDLRNGHGEH